MTELSFDPAIGRLTARISLRGEATPITLEATGIEILDGAEGKSLRVANIILSREWMTAIANLYLKDKSLPVKKQIACILRLLV